MLERSGDQQATHSIVHSHGLVSRVLLPGLEKPSATGQWFPHLTDECAVFWTLRGLEGWAGPAAGRAVRGTPEPPPWLTLHTLTLCGHPAQPCWGCSHGPGAAPTPASRLHVRLCLVPRVAGHAQKHCFRKGRELWRGNLQIREGRGQPDDCEGERDQAGASGCLRCGDGERAG